jgi:hypothetical protein
MTVDEIAEHAENLSGLLELKRSQVRSMKIDSIARERHELAITALAGRVRELRRTVDQLRGDQPTLEIMCVAPGVPPLTHMSVKPEPVRNLPATARDVRPKLG